MFLKRPSILLMLVGVLLLLIGFLTNAISDKPIQSRPIETAGLFVFMFGIVVEVLLRRASLGIKIAACGLGVAVLGESFYLVLSLSNQMGDLFFGVGKWMMIGGGAMHVISTMRLLK